MKLLVVSLIFGLLVGAYCSKIREHRNDFANILEEKCNRHTNNDVAFTQLMNASVEFSNCMETGLNGERPPNPIDDYTQYCEFVQKGGYYKCLDYLANKLVPCLDEDETYFPNFVLTAFNASYIGYCGENGFKRIGEVINDIESSSCLSNSLSMEKLQRSCFTNLILYKNLVSNVFTMKKDDLCSDLRSVKECIIQLLQEQCNEDHSNTIDFMLDPYLAACDA